MIDWIINNYQWFFSGLGVFLLSIVIIVIRFIIRRRMRKIAAIKNIALGNKIQVNIIQSEGNVQISHLTANLKDISNDQILALLEGTKPEILKLETKLEKEKEIYDPEKKKATEYNRRGVQLSREGKYNEALINIRKAISIDTEEKLYKENLVDITENYASSLALDSSLYDEAIALLEKLREERLLNDGHGYWILGYAYYKKKLYEQAISAYQQAIILEPRNYLHYLYLAEAYSDKGIKDKDLNHQEKALNQIAISLRLSPREIINVISDYPYTSFAEIILLKALYEINKGDRGQIKKEYEDFLFRVGCYSSNEIDEIIREWRLSFIIAGITIERFRSRVEEEIGSRVDLDTLVHGVKSIKEIQAMVKEATNKEIPIPALLKLLQINQANEKEKMELAIDLFQQFGEEAVVFARELDKILKKRKRWIVSYQPERE